MFKKFSKASFIVMALYSMAAYTSQGFPIDHNSCNENIFFCFALFNIILGIFGIPISIWIFRLLCNKKNDDLQNSQNDKNYNSQNFNNEKNAWIASNAINEKNDDLQKLKNNKKIKKDKKRLITLNAIIAFELVIAVPLILNILDIGALVAVYVVYAAISISYLRS